jgi:hypothetical protein
MGNKIDIEKGKVYVKPEPVKVTINFSAKSVPLRKNMAPRK